MVDILFLIFIFLNIDIIIRDWKKREISNITLCLILLVSLFFVVVTKDYTLNRLIGCLFLSLPLYVIYLINDNLIGGGDIKLLFVSGLFLGLINMFFSWEIAMLAGLIYLVYLSISKKINTELHIPLGSFIGIGNIVISLLFFS